jgi:acyl dehydratase
MFSMGLLARALTDWAGVGNLTEYRVRFTKQTWPGEELTTSIVVTGKEDAADGKRVQVEVALTNQDGESKLAGSATVIAA